MFCVSCISEHVDELDNTQMGMEILEGKGGLSALFPELCFMWLTMAYTLYIFHILPTYLTGHRAPQPTSRSPSSAYIYFRNFSHGIWNLLYKWQGVSHEPESFFLGRTKSHTSGTPPLIAHSRWNTPKKSPIITKWLRVAEYCKQDDRRWQVLMGLDLRHRPFEEQIHQL
jgi:hypothetical protein